MVAILLVPNNKKSWTLRTESLGMYVPKYILLKIGRQYILYIYTDSQMINDLQNIERTQ